MSEWEGEVLCYGWEQDGKGGRGEGGGLSEAKGREIVVF